MRFFKIFYVIFFFIICFTPVCINQVQGGDFSDSLITILDQRNDSSAFSEIDRLIEKLFYEDIERATILSNKELELALKYNNHLAAGNAILNLGIIYDLQGAYDSALMKYDQALGLSETYDLVNFRGDVYNNLSITNAVLGNMEESVSYALKALSIFENMNDSSNMAKIFNNLGARYSEMEYFDEALEYYQKAAEINESLKDSSKLAYNYGNMGLLYYDLLENEKALNYFHKAIALQDTLHDKFNFSISLHNLALGYNRIGEYKKAMKYEKRAYALSQEINDELGIITSLNGMAAIYKEKGEPLIALEYFHQSETIAKKIGARYYLINIYESMAGLYAKTNDFKNAFIYNQKFNTLKDSIMTTEKDKALQKVKAYENEKKQQEIQLLTKDTEIQKLNLKRQKTIRNSVMAVGALILLLSIGLLNRYRYVRKTRNELSEKNKIINHEKERSDELLLNILPAETAEELKNTGQSEARHFDMVTVMFTDFKGFTFMAEKMSAKELVNDIDYCFKQFDKIVSKHNIEKIKTIGDAYMCAGGLPVANTTNPNDVVLAGLEIQQFMLDLKEKRIAENKPYFELRLGIHTGPVVAGIVGSRKFQYDIWGDTVNIASRMESSGEVGRVNISQMTYEKVKSQFDCEYRGKIKAKNKGAIDMYFVNSPF